MSDPATSGENAIELRRNSLERLTNATSRPVALFGTAALAIFNAGYSAAHGSARSQWQHAEGQPT